MRWIAGVLMGGALLIATWVATAGAGTVDTARHLSGFVGSVEFVDSDRDANRLRIRVGHRGQRVTFRDTAAPIESRSDRCEEAPAVSFRADCRLKHAFLVDLFVDTRGGDDRLTSEAQERYPGFRYSFAAFVLGNGDDRLDGGRAGELIFSGRGADTLEAGAGYDFFVSGPEGDGADVYDGGAASAGLTYQARASRVFVDLDGVADDGAAGEGDQVIDVDQLLGGSAADTLVGDDADNFFAGGPGPDVLETGLGDDQIFGGRGGDEIDAGPGRDAILDIEQSARGSIDCGYGRDAVLVRTSERLRGCELVFRLGSPRAVPTKRKMAGWAHGATVADLERAVQTGDPGKLRGLTRRP